MTLSVDLCLLLLGEALVVIFLLPSFDLSLDMRGDRDADVFGILAILLLREKERDNLFLKQ